MADLILNPSHFDVALENMETFAKEIFCGQNNIQKMKLFEKLQNLSYKRFNKQLFGDIIKRL